MLLLVHCLAPCLAMTVTNISTDQSALLALKAHISSDPNKVLLNNWTTGSSVCNWIGVICNTRHKRVAALNIPDMGLIGTIPPHLGNLSFLVRLDIANNSFHGDLPKELANLRRLELFDVRFNNFGTISQEITNLHRMEILEMEHNQLTGSIPISIFNISSLQVIAFTGNGLSGNLPANMCHRHLPKLKFIYLSRNQFDGQIPSGLSECSQLQELSLSFNKFRGPIPAEIGNLTMLKKLYLGRNNFKGSIPQEIGELHSLELLDLSFNSLIGPIPSNIFNISTLQVLGLVDNHLSGYLPSSIGNWLPNVEGLYLALNKLTGIIPDSISNASKLISLDVAMNSFTGVIPDTIGNLKFIQLFNIGGNNLTSKSSMPQDNFLTSLIKCKQLRILLIEENPLNVILPITIGNLSYLESFDASNCKITSSIPEGIGDLSNLVTIKLRDNDLSGEIPTKVGELWKLQYLDLSGNKLQPSIPSNLCNLRNLAFLFLSRNKLSGPLPTCLGNLSFLRSLQVDSNGLTSTIPLTLWNLKDLLVLNLSSNTLSGALSSEIEKLNVVTQIDLSRNQLSGPIPKSIGSLISLEFLDLSQNNFSDVIPKSLEQLSYRKYLDLSSNMLEGEIPEGGPFVNFTARSFLWNKALCGMRRFQVQPCTSNHHRSRETMVLVLKYILPITASLVLILLSIYALATCQKRKAETSSQENLFPGIKPRRFSYQELLQATSGFTNHNLLGTGSFSSVYKGMLSDGMMVAIKVFDLQLEGSLKNFENECEVMRNVRHRNLIKVIGNCSNLDFKALVLDFMPNGSLKKWLYNLGYCLDILDRMNIMINVALALEYLHHGYSTPVVHCDVKPSNVLLDEDMVAHLGDYSIAKLLGKQDSMAQTKTLATIGYIAPEYGSEGIVSPKGDVYSYGIMLMETFTMKKPTDEMFAGELSLKNWVNESLTCAVSKVIQVDILGKDDEHYNVKEHCIKSIMQLAISWCADSPGERLDIKDVLSTLEKIKVEFLTNTQGA
ncbi:hypothetical protein ACSBR1_015844 [Camellia fascicularis]